ncbi:hypothetical protein CASFOL_006691 [Castilleja foliolosa]|uniref:Uncharacterized protein n=1 Tax=Castilleja foliolosa TaxID=1961234 RepID=A0ABD3E742_9LAMI
MNKTLAMVKREVGESMAKKGTQNRGVGKSKNPTESDVHPRQWTSGISKGDSHKQMTLFRAKYCAAILCDEANTNGKSNLSTAVRFCKTEKIKTAALELDDELSNTLAGEP